MALVGSIGSIGCTGKCSNTQVQGDPPQTNNCDLVLGFTRQGLCTCGKTKLRKKSMTGVWTEIGNECPYCPSNNQVSLLKFTIKILKNRISKISSSRASTLIGCWLEGNHFRRKNNDVLLLKDQVAAALAAAEEKLATAEEKLATAEEKLATAEEKLAEERQEKIFQIRSYSQKIVVLGGALTELRAELAKERQKNDELGKKLVATQKIAFDHAVFTAGFKDCVRETALDILKNPLCLVWGEDSITDIIIHPVKHASWIREAVVSN